MILNNRIIQTTYPLSYGKPYTRSRVLSRLAVPVER